MPASELKATRVNSRPGISVIYIYIYIYMRYQVLGLVKTHLGGKRCSCGPVAILSRVMTAMKGRRALIKSRATFEQGKGNLISMAP
jgi:hypothetical protein